MTSETTGDLAAIEAAPIVTSVQTVEKAWIDYNGHMNVAYYTLAFDRALDEVYDLWGVGPALIPTHNMGPMALQTQIHYMAELLEGEGFHAECLLIDCDHKRVHVVMTMIAEKTGKPCAVYETLSTNVDLGQRRSANYPAEHAARLQAWKAAHAGLPRPAQVGATIGIRRR